MPASRTTSPGTPTARLLLRPFRPSDWRAVLAYQSDPRYLARSHWKRRTSRDAKAFVAMMMRGWRARPRKFCHAVVLRRTGALIGNASLRPGRTGADIGYEIAPDFWRRGYATEAAGALLDLGRRLGFTRIEAWCWSDNLPSRRLLRKLGFRQVGVDARFRKVHGRWRGRRRFVHVGNAAPTGMPPRT